MDRRHGFFIAVAIGLAAVAGTYAAFQTTDLGAQAATSSEQEIAAADAQLDRQEAALRQAARKRPPKLPELPERAAGAGAPVAVVAPPAAAAPPASAAPPAAGGHHDDDLEDLLDDREDAYEDLLDDREDAMEDAADEAEDAAEEARDDDD